MPNPSKRKGTGFEREVVKLLQEHGLSAERMPLSGAAGGSFTGDVRCPVRGADKRFECKRRRRAYGTLYKHLGENFGLVVRDDDTPALVVLRLRDFAPLARGGE